MSLFALGGALLPGGAWASHDEHGGKSTQVAQVDTNRGRGPAFGGDSLSFIEPVKPSEQLPPENPTGPVEWGPLTRQSSYYLGIMHGFRLLTEPGTRSGLRGPFFGNYLRALGNLHGIADGDEFYVNYIGHPIQGAVSGFLFRQNDPTYRDVEFGRNKRYWKSRLRSAAFAWAFSTQFEIGPVSEASIGAIQSSYPQQGFIDHIATPTLGAAWGIGEDALDRYLIRRIERETSNPWIRGIARSALNPARSFSNTLAGKVFWHRNDRPGILAYQPETDGNHRRADEELPPDVEGVPPFELYLPAQFTLLGGRPCAGGGAEAAFRINRAWQWALQVTGCNQFGLPKDWSGDTLTYVVGPRWQPAGGSRWSPYLHVLIGGQKITQEWLDREAKRKLAKPSDTVELRNEKHLLYTNSYETNGLAMVMGGGVHLGFHRAVAFRIAGLDYVQAWNNTLNRIDYGRGLRFSTGITLRVGTW